MIERSGILFVDDEVDNVLGIADILHEALEERVQVVATVEEAVECLLAHHWSLVVMDLFIPLGPHPERILGPRAARYQEQVDHLGGLVLLEEIERMEDPPPVVSHTACTDHVLLELFGDHVARRIPKPAPMDTVLTNIMDIMRPRTF